MTSYAYDASDAVTAIVHAKAGVMIDQSRYGYDAAGRRTSVEQHDGPRTYSYDAAGRVTGADNPSPMADEVFAYDELGNRTNHGEVVDAANRLQSRTGYTYAWDREGRLTARTNTQTGETTRFSWSDDGRLRTVTLPSGGTVRYAYDPLGRRIATTSAGGVRRVQTYGLDPNAVAEQTGGDPRTRYTFALGYDTPLAMTTTSSASSAVFFQQDALSSVTSLTNTAGAVTGRTTYDTYGQITSQTGQVSPYTYTGREYDVATGLYQYRARWYDPAVGRFTSEDPVPAANLYAYADGKPTTLVDPTGLTGTLSEQEEVMVWGNQITPFQNGIFNAVFAGVAQGTRCGWDAEEVAKTAALNFVTGFAGGWLGNKLFRAMGPPGDRVGGQIGLFMANALTGGLSVFVGELYENGWDGIHWWGVLAGGFGAGVGGAWAGSSDVGGTTILSASASAFATLATELGNSGPGSPPRC